MKILRKAGKTILAGIVATAILSLLMCFYFLLPVHIDNKNGSTDYIWPAKSVWFKATEGISWGKFDENGFNNLSAVDNPDIVILGSSHTEATNVLQDETFTYLLGNKLKNRYTVYNMGISGHTLYKICQNIPDTMKLYDTVPKIVILETSSVDIQQEKVNQVLNKTSEHLPSYGTGLIGALQKIPFLRTVYTQVDEGLIDLFLPSSDITTATNNISVSDNVDEKAYADLFNYLSEIEKQYNTQILVFYHPTGTIGENGTIDFGNGLSSKTFKKYADSFGINYVDMTSSFEDMFYNEHHVAHGFITGKLEDGHLNKYGHSEIANSVYDEIMKMEADGEICQ